MSMNFWIDATMSNKKKLFNIITMYWENWFGICKFKLENFKILLIGLSLWIQFDKVGFHQYQSLSADYWLKRLERSIALRVEMCVKCKRKNIYKI